jgi:hypothetical protein
MAILFIHELTVGERRSIVVVGRHVGGPLDDRLSRTLYYSVFESAGVFNNGNAARQGHCFVLNADDRRFFEYTQVVQMWLGAPDESHPGSFAIPVQIDGRNGSFRGKLTAQNKIEVTWVPGLLVEKRMKMPACLAIARPLDNGNIRFCSAHR